VLGRIRRWGAPLASLVVLLSLPFADGASALTSRYDGVVQGGLAVTGNSLGLSKKTNANEAGTLDSIGALMGGSGTVGDFPAGTTLDWTKDESSAALVLPAGAKVLYADLVWGGSYEFGADNLTAFLNTNVLLRSGSDSLAVTPDEEAAETISETADQGFAVRNYTRTAEVTEFVAAHGAGTYTAGGIPLTTAAASNTLNAGGWALYVVYEAPGEPVRWVDYLFGGGFVDETQSFDLEFLDYCAPEDRPVSGRVRVSAQEGDANRNGDQLLTGPDPLNLTALSSPNNPVNNFFASQINLANGTIDTSGTFGNRNHNAETDTNVSAGRQGWDVGAAAIAGLSVGQEGLAIRAATTNDTYVLTGLGVEATIDAPEFADDSGTLGAASIAVGTGTTLTVPLQNSGPVDAQDVSFSLQLPAGLTLSSFAVDGTPVAATAESLGTGIDIGDVASGASRTVTVGLTAGAAGSFELAPRWRFGFEQCVGADLTPDTAAGAVLTLNATAPGGGGGGTGGSGGGGGGAAVDPAKIAFGKLVLNRAKGTGTIALRVNGPGTVSTSGKGLVSAKKKAAKAGTVKLALKAKGNAKAALNETGKARIKVSFKFQPAGGAAVTKTKTVTLLKNVSAQG